MFTEFFINKCLYNIDGVFSNMPYKTTFPPNGIIRFINDELESIYIYGSFLYNEHDITGTLKFDIVGNSDIKFNSFYTAHNYKNSWNYLKKLKLENEIKSNGNITDFDDLFLKKNRMESGGKIKYLTIDGVTGKCVSENRFLPSGKLLYTYDHVRHVYNNMDYIQIVKERSENPYSKAGKGFYDCFKRDPDTNSVIDGYRLSPCDFLTHPDKFDFLVNEGIIDTNVSVKANTLYQKKQPRYWPYLNNQTPFKTFYKWEKKESNNGRDTDSINIRDDWIMNKNVMYILLDNKRFIPNY